MSLGLLIKSVDAHDRRMHRLQISVYGRQVLEANASFVRKMNDLLFGGLTADEVRQLATVLSKLTSRSERTAAILDTHYKLKHGDNGEN